MTYRGSGGSDSDKPGTPLFVEQHEFDDFKGKVITELSGVKRAITEDARSRARRDSLITEKLEALAAQKRKADSDPPKYEDITGRFEIEGRKIVEKAAQKVTVKQNRRTFTFSGLGTALAIAIVELVKAYFQARGH